MKAVPKSVKAVCLLAGVFCLSCASKARVQKEIVQWTTEPVAETALAAAPNGEADSREIASDEPDVIAEAAAEIAAEEAGRVTRAPQVAAAPATMVEEVESHMKSDEESALYKTVYVSLDESRMFRNGFYNFTQDCAMRASADRESAVLGTVNKGKRLWVDDHRGEWAKVYRKTGPAFVDKGCLQ